ncbi:hypothetical protein CASFOL_040057 [Castilleja foliolosa]|uniref:Uncharacterized protein n=1 Tax=Castilleja foliolosa TaxID=1961234 RepID=A0ABD3BEE5_9LAMI
MEMLIWPPLGIEDTLAEDMKLILEEEEKKASLVYILKDVLFIRSE